MLDLLLQAAIVGMATWRISNLFVKENGPWRIFEKLRTKSGHKELLTGGTLVPDTNLAQALDCVWCFSVWATVPIWFLYILSPDVVFILAAMSMAVLIDKEMQS